MVCSLWTKRSKACHIFSSELTSHVSLHHHLVFQKRESLVPWSKPTIPLHCNSSPLCFCVSLSSYKSPTATEIPTSRSQQPWLTGWRGASGLGKVPRRWVGQGYRDSSNASSAQREKVGRVEGHRGRSSEGHGRIKSDDRVQWFVKKDKCWFRFSSPSNLSCRHLQGSWFPGL